MVCLELTSELPLSAFDGDEAPTDKISNEDSNEDTTLQIDLIPDSDGSEYDLLYTDYYPEVQPGEEGSSTSEEYEEYTDSEE